VSFSETTKFIWSKVANCTIADLKLHQNLDRHRLWHRSLQVLSTVSGKKADRINKTCEFRD